VSAPAIGIAGMAAAAAGLLEAVAAGGSSVEMTFRSVVSEYERWIRRWRSLS
jgi:hypothetical protein